MRKNLYKEYTTYVYEWLNEHNISRKEIDMLYLDALMKPNTSLEEPNRPMSELHVFIEFVALVKKQKWYVEDTLLGYFDWLFAKQNEQEPIFTFIENGKKYFCKDDCSYLKNSLCTKPPYHNVHMEKCIIEYDICPSFRTISDSGLFKEQNCICGRLITLDDIGLCKTMTMRKDRDIQIICKYVCECGKEYIYTEKLHVDAQTLEPAD